MKNEQESHLPTSACQTIQPSRLGTDGQETPLLMKARDMAADTLLKL